MLFYKELPRGTEAEPTKGAPFGARAAHVFNVAQVNAAQPPVNAPAPSDAPDPLPAFDNFVTATGAAIRHGLIRACYVTATDTIYLPPRGTFRTPTGYAGTLAHELVHWTVAPNRLARDLTGRFGARAYAAEELVAELGAAFASRPRHRAHAPPRPRRLLRILGTTTTRRPPRDQPRGGPSLAGGRVPRDAATVRSSAD